MHTKRQTRIISEMKFDRKPIGRIWEEYLQGGWNCIKKKMTRWVVEWVEESPQKMLLCVWHVCCGLHKKYDFCGHLWNSAVTKCAGYYSGYADMIARWIAKNHDAQNRMTGNLAWSCALGPGRHWTHAFIFSPIFVTAGRVRTQVISVSDHFLLRKESH